MPVPSQCFEPVLRSVWQGLTGTVLILLMASGSTSLLAADRLLWELPEDSLYADHLRQLQLPHQAEAISAVSLAGDLPRQSLPGDTLTVLTPTAGQLHYQVRTAHRQPNGDFAVRALLDDSLLPQLLTLTANQESLIASLYTPSGRWYVSAAWLAAEQRYVGWLYQFPARLTRLPADEGAVADKPGQRQYLALNSNAVSISQTLSTENATIGDQLDVRVTITNRLSSTLANESVNILFIADNTRYLGSSPGCLLGSTGSQSTIRCTISSLTPGSSITYEYSVRLTADSYPQVVSGVFVGELFGGHARDDRFVFVNQDTLSDADGDGFTDFNEALLGTQANDASSRPEADTLAQVDLLFLYTPRFAEDAGGVAPETRINQLVELTNGYYASSGAGIEFRAVYYGDVNYTVTSLSEALDDIGQGSGVFANIADLRQQVGADIVVLLDGILDKVDSCGLGRTPGVGFNGELFHPSINNPGLISVLYLDGFPAGGGSGCADDTLAHELGHNFGLVHSRRESTAQGTLPWSHGYGVDGVFATIMAYASRFPGSTGVPLFSNPDSNACQGLACGVSRQDTEQGADAVHSLNHTRFQVAAAWPSRLLPVASLGGQSHAIMYGGAARTGTDAAESRFSPEDSIEVEASLAIPSGDRGREGLTYMIIAVDGLGLFYVDTRGNYIPWNGELATLAANTEPHPLTNTEELVAFSDFVPARYGIDSASLTVYFAYSVLADGSFVYSADGIHFTIQP